MERNLSQHNCNPYLDHRRWKDGVDSTKLTPSTSSVSRVSEQNKLLNVIDVSGMGEIVPLLVYS